MRNIIDILAKRGFIQQLTHPDEISRRFAAEKMTCYVGIDPTATSLHVGHLLPLMMMKHLQDAGHFILIIVGGGTVMVGDPSGKTEMRSMMMPCEIEENKRRINEQISSLLKLGDGKAEMLDNADWLLELNLMGFLCEIGSQFSVNRMLTADAYRARMERPEGGLSFFELAYMLLQSYDFLHLNRKYGCNVQIGGDDQWSNIISGVDLIRRLDHKKAYGITIPLLTTSDGNKMGKTEKGAVWLDPDRTSPYEFYQFWRNVHDDDVRRFLLLYTMLPTSEVERLSHAGGSALNEAKKVLAFEITKLIHGETEARRAADSAIALFGGGGDGIAMPTTIISETDISSGVLVVDALVLCGLCATRSDARRLIQQNGLSVNDAKVSDLNMVLLPSDIVDSRILLRKGKKDFHALKIGQ